MSVGVRPDFQCPASRLLSSLWLSSGFNVESELGSCHPFPCPKIIQVAEAGTVPGGVSGDPRAEDRPTLQGLRREGEAFSLLLVQNGFIQLEFKFTSIPLTHFKCAIQ